MIEKILAQDGRVLPPISPDDLEKTTGIKNFWDDPLEIVQFAITYIILPIMAGLAVLYLVWSGYQFFTSAGNPEAAQKARQNLIYSIIGVILTVSAYALVGGLGRLIESASGG